MQGRKTTHICSKGAKDITAHKMNKLGIKIYSTGLIQLIITYQLQYILEKA